MTGNDHNPMRIRQDDRTIYSRFAGGGRLLVVGLYLVAFLALATHVMP